MSVYSTDAHIPFEHHSIHQRRLCYRSTSYLAHAHIVHIETGLVRRHHTHCTQLKVRAALLTTCFRGQIRENVLISPLFAHDGRAHHTPNGLLVVYIGQRLTHALIQSL
jgi:hypothetical protein